MVNDVSSAKGESKGQRRILRRGLDWIVLRMQRRQGEKEEYTHNQVGDGRRLG